MALCMELPCRVLVLARVSPGRPAAPAAPCGSVRLLALWRATAVAPEPGGGRQFGEANLALGRSACLRADEGLRGMSEGELDAVVYAGRDRWRSGAVGGDSDLARFFRTNGCRSAIVVPLGCLGSVHEATPAAHGRAVPAPDCAVAAADCAAPAPGAAARTAREDGLYVLAVGLDVGSAEIAGPLQFLLSLVGGC